MNWLNRINNRLRELQHGQIQTLTLLLVVVVAVTLVVVVLEGVSLVNIGSATTYLEDRGYAVFAQGEYSDLSTKVDTLLLHNENETFLFPEGVSDTVTLTAGNGVNTFGAWAEIVDNNPVSLSSVFAANDGYLVEIMLRTYSVPNEIYIIEVATANDGTHVIGRDKIRSDWTYIRAFRSARVLTGDTIYYRMKAETALATVVADFRYYYR